MTFGLAQFVLTIGVLLIFQQGVARQITFEQGIQHDGTGNWTATGQVQLSNNDTSIFEPLVQVLVVKEVCSVNLSSCAADGEALPTSDPCYCTQVTDEDFSLYVSGQGDSLDQDLTVRATVPSRHLSNPLMLSETIGEVPAADQEGGSQDVLSNRVKELEESLEAKSRALGSLIAKLEESDEMKKKMAELIDVISELKGKLENQSQTIMSQEITIGNLYHAVNQSSKIMKSIYNRAIPPCSDIKSSGPRSIETLSDGMEVVCDTVTDNGGWVLFQRRASDDVDFFRNWADYKNGFGEKNGNFWLGLENIHRLTLKHQYELRVDIVYKGKPYLANYDSFKVLGEELNYQLMVSGYTGNAGDSLAGRHNGIPFSTYDRDNDLLSDNCARLYHGAWWYDRCHTSNLNGLWNSTASGKGLNWHTTTKYSASVSFTEMKMRARSLCS